MCNKQNIIFSLIYREMCRMDAVLMGTQHSVLKPFCSEIFVHFPTTIVLIHLTPPFLGWRVNKRWTIWAIILTFHLCYSQKSLMGQKQWDNTHLHAFGIHTQPIKEDTLSELPWAQTTVHEKAKIKSIVNRKTGKICLVVEVLPIHARMTLMCHKMIEKREAWFDLICRRIERERVGWWEKFHNKKVNSQRMTKRAHFS